MFIHRFKLEGMEACGQAHATTAEARECEEATEAAWYEPPTCSLCDGIGHGYGGTPCPLEERGYWEARAQEDWEASRGVFA